MSKLLPFLLLAAMGLGAPAAHGLDLGSVDPGSRHEFRDDVWVGGEPLGARALIRALWSGTQDCAVRLRSCVVGFRHVDLLTTAAADGSANRTVNINGRALGETRVVTIERPSASGLLADLGIATAWEVGGEETLDAVGAHAWEILDPDASPNAPWLPIRSYRFVESSPWSMNDSPPALVADAAPATPAVWFAAPSCDGAGGRAACASRSATGVPEASTWRMVFVGFAATGCGSLLRRHSWRSWASVQGLAPAPDQDHQPSHAQAAATE